MLSEMSAAEVKKYIETLSLNDQSHLIEELKADKRKSVNLLGVRIEKRIEKHENELARIAQMHTFENEARGKGFVLIAGLDEAGRGPLMGPVVASAVVLPENCVIEGLDDSKKLSEQKREALYEIIQEKAIAIGVGMADPAEIDEINILNATKRSMKRAIEDLGESPDYLLIDAVELADIDTEQLALIKGDARSLSIAAASVIAKVTRDRIVAEMDQTYPGYGFAQHKGYGTKAHYEAIENYGITPVHRRSFLKNIL
jgi:ribonuclease HII